MIVSVSLPSDGTTADVSDYNTPITQIVSALNGQLDDNNILSVSGTKITSATVPLSALDATARQGWITGVLPAVSSVVENGNRSATITFASTVASILSPGMRLRTSRTVTAPTYMGGLLNGTNQYFTKATCTSTLSTVTDNFTIMAYVEPTAYALGYILGRADSTPTTGFFVRLTAAGQVEVGIFNGGGANYRTVASQQSIPLNKKSHIAVSWASGTVLIYINGVSVPVTTATVSGTNPTVASAAAADFSIGRNGALNASYFAGYVSGVSIFNAVLSASTIRAYKNQILSGSETNCIGAWSLNNTAVNQQAAGTNDLTATNSASYTARSPYTTDNSGISAGTYDWCLVTKVSTTAVTVQYPDGCAIATTGGISAVDYSTVANPFNWVTDKDRWAVISQMNIRVTGLLISGTAYNLGSFQLLVPIGQWEVDVSAALYAVTSAAAQTNTLADLATTAAVAASLGSQFYQIGSYFSSVVESSHKFNKKGYLNLSSATTYYFNTQTSSTGTLTANQLFGDRESAIIRALPVGL